jgi:hypothetical protein
MKNKFDRAAFHKELSHVINKYSNQHNEFSNAEIVAGMTSIYIDVIKQGIVDKKAGKYLLENIIEEAFK